MRKLLCCLFCGFLLLMVSIFSAADASAQNVSENPVDYLSAVGNIQTEMNAKYMAYISAVAHGRRARKIEKMRMQTLDAITNSRYKTIELPYFKKDNSLRQSSIEYIQLCYSVFNEDYAKIVNMEEIAEQSFDQMQAYILLQEKTSEKLKQASDKMQQASKDFAAKNNITLVNKQTELGDKMEIAGELNHYMNKIFLVFFKCNWQDNELIKAINSKKVTDIEQARSAIIKYAVEGLQALDTIKNFKGDGTLAMACRQALQYYKKTAENDIPKVTDFFLLEENFAKQQKTIDAKGSGRTKEDVDAFNKLVKDFNNGVNAYNKLNNNLNANRNRILENWQSAEKGFADAHMPHYK